MHATLRWAAPAVLFALAVGCSQEASTTKNRPNTMPSKGDSALANANEVTLKVEGMV